MEQPIKLDDEILSGLYEQRLLVFLEVEPQSNKYNQILLGREQFKEVSEAISKTFKAVRDKDGMDRMIIASSVEEYTLPDLQSMDHGI